MASRLSEIENWKVLLLEAGPDENEISDVPSLAAYLQLSKLDWSYKLESTGRACLGNHIPSLSGQFDYELFIRNEKWTM